MGTNSFHIQFGCVNSSFVGMAQHLSLLGERISPRGMETLELHPITIEITNPSDAVVVHPRRKMRYDFLALEPVWILSGDDEPWITNHLKSLDRFTDLVDGKKKLLGAYGPRIRTRYGKDQLAYVIQKLKEDPHSRQAKIAVIDPSADMENNKDIACTQVFSFVIRNGKLNLTTYMRSNDWYLGYVYDTFTFILIQHVVASILKVPVGTYFHIANSFHVYSNHFEAMREISDNPDERIDPGVPSLSTMDYDSLDEVYADASYGKYLKESGLVPPSGKYLARLMKYAVDHSKNIERLGAK